MKTWQKIALIGGGVAVAGVTLWLVLKPKTKYAIGDTLKLVGEDTYTYKITNIQTVAGVKQYVLWRSEAFALNCADVDNSSLWVKVGG